VLPGEEGEAAPAEPAISLPLIFTWWPTSLLSLESSPWSCQVLPELSVKVQLPAEPDKQPSIVFPSVSLVCEELACEEVGLAAGEVLCATTKAEHSSRRAVNNQNFLITSPWDFDFAKWRNDCDETRDEQVAPVNKRSRAAGNQQQLTSRRFIAFLLRLNGFGFCLCS